MNTKSKQGTATSYKLQAKGCAERGVTLIDTVVGTALMLVIFVGVAAAFQLSVDVVTNNKARAGAIALANERMEYLRALAYAQVGTVGGIPPGVAVPNETILLNGVTYSRRTYVAYVDDPKDGLGALDTNSITADYKTAKIEVSWTRRTTEREVQLVTRIEPQNGMEIACTPPCGTLMINTVNSLGQPLPHAQVNIVNTGASVNLVTFTNASGTVALVGAPAASGYQVTVSGTGYSTAQTYSSTAQNANPNPAHLTVSNGQTTSSTFAIDLLSSIGVETFSLVTSTWTDTFSDTSKISAQSVNIEVSGNRARFEGQQPWTEPAELLSQTITPVALSRWGVFSWDDTQPAETVTTYHVYYPSAGVRTLVPESILPGNTAGFSTPPVDLTGVSAAMYPSLILGANLVALNPSAPSPSIEDWSLTYQSGQGLVIPFTLRGAKTIGSGPSGPVYKYSQLHTSSATGVLHIPNLEWDSYLISVAESTSYTIASACAPQPINLAPNTSVQVRLYFAQRTANSLLVDVKNSSDQILSGATVRLQKGGSYDQTIVSDACGQAFFSDLTNGNYTVTVSSPGYATSVNSSVDVTGATLYSATLN